MALASIARVAKQTIKKTVLGGLVFVISLSGLAVAAPLFLSQPALAAGSSPVIYNALPSTSPDTSYPSQPFQAQQTSEFGDSISLGGTNRVLDKVTVTMEDWALYSQWSSDARYSGNSTNWTLPMTLNVYGTHLNANGVPDNLLATTTQTVSIPWRPAQDPTNCPTPYGGVYGWKDSTGACHYGIASNVTFDLSSQLVTLPGNIIVSVAYNTQTYGASPIGADGPYNSLNVAVPDNQAVTVGSDASADSVFWNTSTCSYYSDATSKTTCGAGHRGLMQDTNWTPNGTVALEVTALSSDASLSSLSLSSGTLSPTFSSSTTSYSASVANSVTSVTSSYVTNSGGGVVVSGGSNLAVGTNTVTVTVTSADHTATNTYTITVTRAAPAQTVPNSSGSATVNSSTPQLVVTSQSQPLTVTVASGTSNATIDYSALKTSGTTAVVPETTIETQNASVQIQGGTTVTASGTWNGIISLPTVLSNSSVTIPTSSGTVTTVGTVIEVGSTSTNLTFDKAVRLLIPGQAGKSVGFERGGVFTQITNACSADSQAVGNALPAGGDCYIGAGSDMVVWTKHFTEFITYTKSNTYVVQSGDTMSGIAYKYGLTLAQLEALNPSAGHPAGNFSLIMPGDVLNVGSAVQVASASRGSGSTSSVLGENTSGSGLIGSAASTTKPQVKAAQTVASASTPKNDNTWYWSLGTAAVVVIIAYGAYSFVLPKLGKK